MSNKWITYAAVLFIATLAFAVPVSTAEAWCCRPSYTKTAIWGKGFGGPPVEMGTQSLPCENVMVWNDFVRNWYEFIWSEDSCGPDPRMTSATGDPEAPQEEWMGHYGATENRMSMILDTTVEAGMEGVLRSKNTLLPVAYWDECAQTYTGWWEGWSWGNMWVDDAGMQQFIFWHRLRARLKRFRMSRSLS